MRNAPPLSGQRSARTFFCRSVMQRVVYLGFTRGHVAEQVIIQVWISRQPDDI